MKKYLFLFTTLSLFSFFTFNIDKKDIDAVLLANVEALTMSEIYSTDCIACSNSFCCIKVQLTDGSIRNMKIPNAIHYILC